MAVHHDRVLSAALAIIVTVTSLCTLLLIVGTVGTYVATGSLAVNTVIGDSMEPTLTSGDVVISDPTVGIQAIERGDIIRFTHPGNSSATIMHRVTAVQTDAETTPRQLETRGDNNPITDQMAGMPPVQASDLQSKVLLSLPGGIAIVSLIPLSAICSLLVFVYRR